VVPEIVWGRRDRAIVKRTEITPSQAAIFKAADVAEPPRYVRVATPQAAPAAAG
jgi:hypothetical protein